MRLLKLILLSVFLIPSLAFAADCVSAGDGAWTNPSNWSSCGGGVPGDGDTATITGHAITIANSSTITIGADGATNTEAINLSNSTASLTIGADATLNVKGSIEIDAGAFVVGAGATIDFNVTNAQRIYIGDNYDTSPTEVFLDINGTSGNRVTLTESGAGTVNIQCRNGEDHPCRMSMDYTDITNLGSSSVDSISTTLRSDNDYFRLTNVTIDGAGQVDNEIGMNPAAHYELTNVTIRNSLNSTYGIRIYNTNCASATTGDRIIDGTVFEDTVRNQEMCHFTITDTFFLAGVSHITSSGESYTLEDVVMYEDNVTEQTWAFSSATDVLYIGDDSDATNPHLLTGLPGDYDQTITRLVVTCNWTDDNGDIILLSVQPTANRTLTINNSIAFGGPSDNGCGTLISQLGNQYTQFAVEHNTAVIDSQPFIAVGETYAGRSGLSTNVTNNLVVNITGLTASGYIVADSGVDDSVSDLITSGNIDYNGIFNLAGATNNLEFSSGTPNTNGVTGDPSFSGSMTVTVADYRDSVKSTTGSTIANVIDELRKKNDSDWDTDYEVNTMLDWFAGQAQPTNASFEAASDLTNGGWMGAVEGLSATPTPTPTATGTPTPTPSPSATPTPSPSATPTPSPSPSPTPTPSPSATPTPSPSATPTATPTLEPTPTPTPTLEPTPTPTATGTPTPTPSPSATPTPSATPENGTSGTLMGVW